MNLGSTTGSWLRTLYAHRFPRRRSPGTSPRRTIGLYTTPRSAAPSSTEAARGRTDAASRQCSLPDGGGQTAPNAYRRIHPIYVALREELYLFETKEVPSEPTAIAPDGSDVRVLLSTGRGAIAHFEFPPGAVAPAVEHATVDELWLFLSGRGQMWRQGDGREEIVDVRAGVCVSIPVGTVFQVRSFGHEPLAAVGATMPPWPGEGEATIVEGRWTPTLDPGSV